MTGRVRALGAAAVAAAALAWAAPTGWAADATVSTTASNTFTPATVRIDRGDTVTWVNEGGLNHTVTSTSTNWSKDDSIPLPGATTAHTFTRAGTYTYVCQTHAPGMKGTVIVRAPSPTPSPPASPTAKPSPSPTRTASASPAPSSRPTTVVPLPSTEPSPAASRTVAPPVFPTPSLATPRPGSAVSPSSDTLYLGEGGPTPPAPTGRGRGLPILLAVVAAAGVLSAQIRTLLSLPSRPSTEG